MTLTRRQSIDACRGGPALFAGLPGNEIDIERLTEFVAGRGLDAAIHVIDGTLEGILWIKGGVAGEAWFLEADGGETIVPIEPEYELLRDIAASGTVSCYVRSIDTADTAHVARETPAPSPGRPGAGRQTSPSAATVPRGSDPIDDSLPAILRGAPTRPADDRRKPDRGVPSTPDPPSVPPVRSTAAAHDTDVTDGGAAVAPPQVWPVAAPAGAPVSQPESLTVRAPQEPTRAVPQDAALPPAAPATPSAKPWPAILIEVRARVAKQRGKRLAERFTAALSEALEAHGGRVDLDRVIAPPLSDEQWASLIDSVCAPVVAVAGRAWTDRTLEAAERIVLTREGLA